MSLTKEFNKCSRNWTKQEKIFTKVILETIEEKFPKAGVLLFGSRVRGKLTGDIDVGIFGEFPNGSKHQTLKEMFEQHIVESKYFSGNNDPDFFDEMYPEWSERKSTLRISQGKIQIDIVMVYDKNKNELNTTFNHHIILKRRK